MRFFKIVVIAVAVIFLVGCGGTVSDNRNYNFDHNNVAFVDENGNEVKREVFVNKNKTAEFFIDSTAGMSIIAKDENFKKYFSTVMILYRVHLEILKQVFTL